MKYKIYVDNLKCEGCASTITKKVSQFQDLKEVEVDVATGEIQF